MHPAYPSCSGNVYVALYPAFFLKIVLNTLVDKFGIKPIIAPEQNFGAILGSLSINGTENPVGI